MENLRKLKWKTIILNSDYTYTDAFQKALKDFGIRPHEVASEDLNLKMILRGRGDLTIMNEGVYQQYINELSEDQQAMLFIDTKPALVNQGYLVFTRDNSERSHDLARIFDVGYEKIRGQDNLKKHFQTCGF